MLDKQKFQYKTKCGNLYNFCYPKVKGKKKNMWWEIQSDMRILKEEKLISPEGIREVFMGEVTLNISIVRNGAKRFLAEGIKARVEKNKALGKCGAFSRSVWKLICLVSELSTEEWWKIGWDKILGKSKYQVEVLSRKPKLPEVCTLVPGFMFQVLTHCSNLFS